jgi:hypothetical protein
MNFDQRVQPKSTAIESFEESKAPERELIEPFGKTQRYIDFSIVPFGGLNPLQSQRVQEFNTPPGETREQRCQRLLSGLKVRRR